MNIIKRLATAIWVICGILAIPLALSLSFKVTPVLLILTSITWFIIWLPFAYALVYWIFTGKDISNKLLGLDE